MGIAIFKALDANNDGKLDAKEIAINYNLLQVWDMMSLYICSTAVLEPGRIEPVPVAYSGAAGVAMPLTPVRSDTIALNPYPFDQPSLTTTVIFRRLPQNKQTQQELTQLRKELLQAVNKEAYEEAARLRDRIRQLEES